MVTIIGAKGFIGSYYVEQFRHRCIENTKYDYQPHSKDVLYLLGRVNNNSILDEPQKDVDSNISYLLTVLDNWRWRSDSKDGVFNYVSTWAVYGNKEDAKEVDPCHPEDKGLYAITKHVAEQILKCYCDAHGLKYRILRVATVVGGKDPHVSARKNALEFLINKMVNNEDVELHGGGWFYRDYIHVNDCVHALAATILEGHTNSIYNIGNGKPVLFRDIIMYVARKVGTRSRILDVPNTVPVTSFFMNNMKLRNLGYEPRYMGASLWDTLIPGEGNAKDSDCRSELSA